MSQSTIPDLSYYIMGYPTAIVCGMVGKEGGRTVGEVREREEKEQKKKENEEKGKKPQRLQEGEKNQGKKPLDDGNHKNP